MIKGDYIKQNKWPALGIILCLIAIAFCCRHEVKEMVLVLNGNHTYNRGDYGDAEVFYKKAISVNSSNPLISYNLANAYYCQQRYEEAISMYKEALKDKLQNAHAWNNLGNAYFKKGHLSESLQAYKEALLIKGDDSLTQQNYLLVLNRIREGRLKTHANKKVKEKQGSAVDEDGKAQPGKSEEKGTSSDSGASQEQKISEDSNEALFKQLSQQEDAAKARINRLKQKANTSSEFDY
jgi:Ca-activated chloride channel homolog